MVISFDLDSVLAAFQLGWIEYNKVKYKKEYKFEDFTVFDYTKVMGLENAEVYRRIFEFYESDIFRDLDPIPYSIEVVKALSLEHTLYVLTSRSLDIESLTKTWVEKYYPHCFKEILFTGQISKTGYDRSITKQELCKKYDIKLHIEDAPFHVMPIVNAGTRVVVLEKPWNRSVVFDSPMVTRIKALNELPLVISRYKR